MSNLNPKLVSLYLERHSLAGLLRFPHLFPEVDQLVDVSDYTSEVHKAIYTTIQQSLLKNEVVDRVIIAQKISNAGITFHGEVNIFQYLDDIGYGNITEKAALAAFENVVKLRICRELEANSIKEASFITKHIEEPLQRIVTGVDKIHFDRANTLLFDANKPENIFSTVQNTLEERAKLPPTELKFMMGPFPTVNKLYGSLLKPGNYTIVASRSDVGKTSLGMFYTIHAAEKYGIPLLHLDNGEMSAEELQNRAACMFSEGEVPYNVIENGTWDKNKKWKKLMYEKVFPKTNRIKFYYEDISGFKQQDIISYIRRFSYSKVGKGNMFIVHYDYLKPFETSDTRIPEWKEMGHFMQDLKAFIQGEAHIPLWASVQQNRKGITNNKSSGQIDDSEDTISISDKIIQQSTHSFILRRKVMDELSKEDGKYGNLMLLCVKKRHLGEEKERALSPVRIGKNRFKQNYINLRSRSFWFEDLGDLRQMVEELQDKYELSEGQTEEKDEDVLA